MDGRHIKPLRVGYWGRLTDTRVRPDDADRTALRFHDTFLPGFDHVDGLSGATLVLNRDTGDGYAMEWYDSLAALRSSQAGSSESGQLMLDALPTLTPVRTGEIQAVIVEPTADGVLRPAVSPPSPGGSPSGGRARGRRSPRRRPRPG